MLERAKVLNKWFPSIIKNFEISKYPKYESFMDDIEDQTLKVVMQITK